MSKVQMILGFLALGLSHLLPAAEFKYDFSDFRVGTAEYEKGPTGCTVFYFPKGAHAAIDIRGGSAAVRESSSLTEENAWGWIDALVFAGGSTYGLEAASGVAKEILKDRKSVDFDSIPSVPAAVVYDFRNRKNFLYPDLELGARAFKKARTNSVSVGRFGAGANVSVGKLLDSSGAETSGQGAAFFSIDSYKFFALTVVNALGNVLDFQGNILLGSKDSKSGNRLNILEVLKSLPLERSKTSSTGNTTLTVLITNAPLERGELRRVAIASHTAMA
jgi:6-aminohexanoate-oligomer endohydrolase